MTFTRGYTDKSTRPGILLIFKHLRPSQALWSFAPIWQTVKAVSDAID
ncbi:MAG: hypothetical protein JJ975_13335 [Bacteroidia bacterium]|nr:hypothetical protein [Bacteroidia bacterium]